MSKDYDLIRRKEELKELLWAEMFTKYDFWRKELSPKDKAILKELEEELAQIKIKDVKIIE